MFLKYVCLRQFPCQTFMVNILYYVTPDLIIPFPQTFYTEAETVQMHYELFCSKDCFIISTMLASLKMHIDM